MALKPKVMTARELEEQQKEAAKSEEIVKAKASHHSAFLAMTIRDKVSSRFKIIYVNTCRERIRMSRRRRSRGCWPSCGGSRSWWRDWRRTGRLWTRSGRR